MYHYIVCTPCKDFHEKNTVIEGISSSGGQVQGHRIDFGRREIVIRVVVEPERDGQFKKYIDALPGGATLTSGSRGGRR